MRCISSHPRSWRKFRPGGIRGSRQFRKILLIASDPALCQFWMHQQNKNHLKCGKLCSAYAWKFMNKRGAELKIIEEKTTTPRCNIWCFLRLLLRGAPAWNLMFEERRVHVCRLCLQLNKFLGSCTDWQPALFLLPPPHPRWEAIKLSPALPLCKWPETMTAFHLIAYVAAESKE